MRRTPLRGALMLPALVLCLTVVIAVASACGGTTPPAVSTTTVATTASGPTVTSGTADGKALFTANCVRCHGADLAGGVGPKISGRAETDRSRIQTQIKSGGTIMPAFGGTFTDEQIAAIATYVISVK